MGLRVRPVLWGIVAAVTLLWGQGSPWSWSARALAADPPVVQGETPPTDGSGSTPAAAVEAPAPDPIALASKALEYMGGMAALDALESMTFVLTVDDRKSTYEVVYQLPDKYKRTTVIDGVEVSAEIFDGTDWYAVDQSGYNEMPDSAESNFAYNILLTPVGILPRVVKGQIAASYGGTETFDGAQVHVITLSDPSLGGPASLLVSVDDGKLVGIRCIANTLDMLKIYSNYQKVGALVLPVTYTTKSGGVTLVYTKHDIVLDAPLSKGTFIPMAQKLYKSSK